MATPTNVKTWQYALNLTTFADNTTVGNAYESASRRLFQIKSFLTSADDFTTPWTVVSSSDAATAGVGDKWLDAGDLIWRADTGGAIFSWIVLRQAAISATFEVMIGCEQDNTSDDGKRIIVYVSQAGFTGGTTTTRPTATDERRLRSHTEYWGSGQVNTAYDSQTHVWMSDDGECTRIVIYIQGTVTGYWCFEKPANPVPEWTTPYFACVLGTSNITVDQTTYASFYDSANILSYFAGDAVSMYMSGEGFASAAAGEYLTNAGQLTNNWSAGSMGLISTTSPFRGRNGEVFDLRWGFKSTAGEVRYFPADGSKTFVQISDFILPWDGTTLLLTR
jgi:hypothetical protein